MYGDTFGNDSLPEHHATLTIADKIRPNIDKVETYTLKVNDKDEVQDNQIKITVSEAVYEAVYGNLKFDLIIKDKDGNTIANDAYSYTDITGSSNAKSGLLSHSMLMRSSKAAIRKSQFNWHLTDTSWIKLETESHPLMLRK